MILELFKDNYKIALENLNECISNPNKKSLDFLMKESKELIKKVKGNSKRKRLLIIRDVAIKKCLAKQ